MTENNLQKQEYAMIKKYKDEIWLENEETGDKTLVWENSERDDKWKSDEDSDSEYRKMMDLHWEYDFSDYDNCPAFDHYLVENTYFKNGNLKSHKILRITSLIEEYYNT